MRESQTLLAYATHLDPTDEEWDAIVGDELAATPWAGEEGERLWIIASEIAQHRRRLQRLEAALNRRRAADITENGAVRYGDVFNTVAPKTTTKIADLESLLDWARRSAPESDIIPALFRLNSDNLRITALRGLAERVAVAEGKETAEEIESYTKAMEGTFIERTKGDPELKEIPIDKAPKYAQRLEHGHRAGSFKNKPVPADE